MTRRWAHRSAVALVTGLVAGCLLAAAPAYAEPSVSVAGLRQEPGLLEFYLHVRDLEPGQRIDPASVTVSAGGVPLTATEAVEVGTLGRADRTERRLAVLVLDVSGSMFGEPMTTAMDAATRYAAEIPPDVEVAVVTVSSTAQTVLPPTADRDRVAEVLAGLVAFGDTALHDGLALAAELAADPAYGERRVLVLSDGADTSSATPLSEARQRLLSAGAPVDTVAFRTAEDTTELLAGLSAVTGGRAFQATDITGLADAFRSAAGAFTVQLRVQVAVPPELSGVRTTLEVTVAAGGQELATSVPVTLAVDPTVGGPLEQVAAVDLSGPVQLVLAGLVFSALLAVSLLVVAPMLRRRLPRQRLTLDRFTGGNRPRPTPAPSEPQQGGAVARAALALSERVVQSQGLEGRISLELDRAGMRLRPHEWLLLRGLICVSLVLLLSLFVGPMWGLLLGVLIGWAGTALYQIRRAERRRQAFAAALPDALQLVVGSLRSGFSLPQAIDAMVREMPDPLSTEFGRALGEARLGMSLEDALDRVAHRMRSTDLTWAVVAVRVQQEVGGNLAEVLTNTVKTMREREALRRQVRALSAEGRLSAWVLVTLPVVVGAFMFLVRRDYAMVLVTHPIGLIMLGTGIGLLIIGAFWMSRLIRVEV